MPEADERESDILKEGIAFRKGGDLQGALKAFDMVLELNPKNAAAFREIAITLQLMDEKKLAMEAYKAVLKIDPSFRMRKVAPAKRQEKGEEDKLATGYKVADVMTKDLISVPFGSTARDAAELMLKKNISSVGVSEGGELIGIVTERDFIRNHYYISGKDFAETPIKDLVAYPLLTIPADTSLDEASNQMAEQGVRHLLIRDEDKIVGLITLRDIVETYSKLL